MKNPKHRHFLSTIERLRVDHDRLINSLRGIEGINQRHLDLAWFDLDTAIKTLVRTLENAP